MKKRIVFFVLVSLLILASMFAMVACDNNSESNNNGQDSEWGTVYTLDTAYARASQLGYNGSLEEFIELISGADGKDGVDGVDGKDGKDGVDGVDGKDGKDGVDGVDGKDGKDGINGTNGKDGVNGTDGKDGVNGKDGKDGVGIARIEIDDKGNLIITLTNQTHIDLGNVFTCKHEYTEWISTLTPTCTSSGCDIRSCTKCDNKEYKFFEALGHNWNEGCNVVEPDCKKLGLKVFNCADCDATKSEILDKSHSYEDDYCTGCGIPKPTEDFLTFTYPSTNNNCYRVSIRNRNATKIVIPETYKGLPVTEIADNGFVNCSELESVYIPNSITKIGCHGFTNCPKLKSITIPKSVTTIGYDFLALNKIETLIVENGNPVFHSAGNCLIETKSKTLLTGCKNSVIPTDGTVIKIGERAFFRSEISSIIIPESIVQIADRAFQNCQYLKIVYNLSDLDIAPGLLTYGQVTYFAEKVYTSLNGDID